VTSFCPEGKRKEKKKVFLFNFLVRKKKRCLN